MNRRRGLGWRGGELERRRAGLGEGGGQMLPVLLLTRILVVLSQTPSRWQMALLPKVGSKRNEERGRVC
jgi:hypothetical protein